MIATNNHRQLAPSLTNQQGGYDHDHSHPDFWQVGVAKFLGFFPLDTPEETMKTTLCFANDLPSTPPTQPLIFNTLSNFATPPWPERSRRPPTPERPTQKEELRHILLGSPGAIRQTIYLLHSLNYAEPVLWSPIMAVGGQLIITPEQGEAMSLLRRSL